MNKLLFSVKFLQHKIYQIMGDLIKFGGVIFVKILCIF